MLYTKRLKIVLLFSLFLLALIHFLKTPILKSDEQVINLKTTVVSQFKEKQYELNGEKHILLFSEDKLEIGDDITLTCFLKIPSKSTNFYLFDYQKYLLSKGIDYLCLDGQITKVGRSKSKILLGKRFIKKQIEKRKEKAYYKLFLIGSKEDLSSTVQATFNQNGIGHLFALSGMHIGFFVLFLSWLLKRVKFKNVLIISFLLVYFMLANFSYSLLRSLLLYVFKVFKQKKNIPLKDYEFILLLVFILWFLNPFCFYDLGFCFSFTITFFLLRFSKKLLAGNLIKKMFFLSLFCFVIGLPISIKTNFSINLLTPFLNLIFVPFVTYLLMPVVFIALLIPFLEPVLSILIFILEKSSYLIALNKYFTFPMVYINMWFCLGYYVLFYLIFKKFSFKKSMFLIFFLLLIHYLYPYFDNKTYLEVIDVEQGDSMLLSLPHNHNVLIDTGGKVGTNYLSENIIIPTLKARGISKLDYIILSHGDFDHMGEAINLVNNFKVEKVIFNCGEYNELEQSLIKVLDKKKIPYYSCIKELNIDDNKLYFLNDGDYGNENDNSSVIYTELNNYKFLFMGDAGIEVEEDLIEKYNLKDIDVLKVGHHGSKTSSSEVFIDSINPKYSIISVGKNNRYGHPNDSVLDNLNNSKIYRTDKDGSIMFKINRDKLKLEICAP